MFRPRTYCEKIYNKIYENPTANYLPTPAIGFTYVHVSGHSFPALYMAIPTGIGLNFIENSFIDFFDKFPKKIDKKSIVDKNR